MTNYPKSIPFLLSNRDDKNRFGNGKGGRETHARSSIIVNHYIRGK